MSDALKLHEKLQGKIEVKSKVKVENGRDLSVYYTPGVAEPCKKIHEEQDLVYKYTSKGNIIAVVTDGSAVLGLGDIGAHAALPVMEGKAVLFKEFANVDAFPICLDTKDTDEIVKIVKMISPGFGGINLEDISSPRCVEIEKRLIEELDIPVFHDDQHGTAVVVTAALINALKLAGKRFSDIKVCISGAGAAGSAIVSMLKEMGVTDIIAVASRGILSRDVKYENPVHRRIAESTNEKCIKGGLKEAIKGADVFIGVSVGGIVTAEMISAMVDRAIVLAMANPNPEITPDDAKKGGAFIVGTGRSDYANQINNVLAFPGILRGALDCRASKINGEMKTAAAFAIASLVSESELSADYIIPAAFDKRVGMAVKNAVIKAAMESGVARAASKGDES